MDADLLLAILLQAQESMSGADLDFVQDVIYAQTLAEHDRAQILGDRNLARQIQAEQRRRPQESATGTPKTAHILSPANLPLKLHHTCLNCSDPFTLTARAQKKGGEEREDQGFLFPDCLHAVCTDCLVQWITATLKDQSLKFPTGCLSPNCPSELPMSSLPPSLPNDMKELYIERYLLHKGWAIYCPEKTCSSVLEIKGDSNAAIEPRIRCDRCSTMVCAQCRLIDHAPYSCEEAKAMQHAGMDPDEAVLKSIAAQNNWKQCPSCNIMVERIHGCNFLKCRCGKAFCFQCGKAYLHLNSTAGNAHGQPSCVCGLFDYPAADDVVRHNFPAVHRVARMDARRDAHGRRIPPFGGQYLGTASQLPGLIKEAQLAGRCHYCHHEFQTLNGLLSHLLTTRAHPVHMCCNRTFFTYRSLEQHLEMRHAGRRNTYEEQD
ncbi:hypothetical protein BC828DRAFT_373100 [Blastocladiella britannica]|nr:hypothetical protein BC828DRAFT_373100 [Blastocladiella britannica]